MSASAPTRAEVCTELRRKNAPLLLAERARATPDAVAFRAKKLGIYRERTWADYAALVARCAAGLQTLGLERGERVAIMGDAREEWMICDLAVQSAGGISYGIYPTAAATEVEYQMIDGGASLFIAEDQEYVDRILPLLERLPALRWIVVIDAAAMFAYDHPKLKTYADIMQLGGKATIEDLEALARALDPASAAFIVYTSGTTGNPKGAVVSHGRHLAAAFNLVGHYPTLAQKAHRTVVYLPLCHVLGRDVAITLPLISRLVPHFGEELEDLPNTFFEVAPSVLFAVPRYLQKFASQVLVGIANTSPLKRVVYELALHHGRRYARGRWDGSNGPVAAFAYRLLHWLAFRPILNKLGFDRLDLLVCGGAPLPPDTMALWQIWGVNVCEIYGQTEEAGAIITGQAGPFPRPGDVGTVAPGWELRLAESGEILIRGEHVFEGYWGRPEVTREVLADDGWLHTGDIGEWRDEGEESAGPSLPPRLRLVDRARDFIVTSGGKTLSPSYIENILRGSPYVGEVIVFGHSRKYLTALIEIDYDTVADWARSRNIAYTGFTSLAQNPQVQRLLQAEIDRANAQLARVEQIKAFRILPKALDPEEEGEPVTPTRKVKRKLMYERFKELVESMYDDREERLLAAGAGDVLLPGGARLN
ncbi:MAG: AMP-binding protein [Burkholderiales bacterium]